jgi:hypothetical protein
VLDVFRLWFVEIYPFLASHNRRTIVTNTKARLGLVRLFLSHVDWMGLEKIVKDFDLFGIETHPIHMD